MTGRIGEAEKEARTGQAKLVRQNWTGRTRRAETGPAEQKRYNRTGRTGQAEQDRQNRIGRTG
jgi:hypothetical protein